MKTPLPQVGAARSPSFIIILFSCIGACVLLAMWLFSAGSSTSIDDLVVEKAQMKKQPVAQDLSNSNSSKTLEQTESTQSNQALLKSAAELAKTNAQIEAQLQAIKASEALQMELINTLNQLKEEFSQTSAQLRQSNAKVEALAMQEQNLLAQTTGLTKSGDTTDLLSAEINPDAYTIQLASLENLEKVQRFIDGLTAFSELDQPYFYYLSNKQVKPWYPVLYGIFETEAEAAQARARFPKSLKAKAPIIRQVKNNSEPMMKYP